MVSDAITAFFVGFGWAVILLLYGRISDTGAIPSYEGTIHSAIRIGFDTVFVGGGTGVALYVTESHLSSFRYGLAGMMSAFIVVTIATKLRSRH